MTAGLRIVREDRPETPEAMQLQRNIDEYNMDLTCRRDWSPVAFLLRDEAGALRGGVVGDIWGGWLHVRVLWVDAGLRRAGHGGRLLRAAEDLACERGCTGVFLETFSFQGASWYPRFGYEDIGAIDDYPDGHRYHFMQKRFPDDQEKSPG